MTDSDLHAEANSSVCPVVYSVIAEIIFEADTQICPCCCDNWVFDRVIPHLYSLQVLLKNFMALAIHELFRHHKSMLVSTPLVE